MPTERPPLVGTVSANFCHVVSVTDPYDRILGFLDRIEKQIVSLFYFMLQCYTYAYVSIKQFMNPCIMLRTASVV
jgi:hypothetical protein